MPVEIRRGSSRFIERNQPGESAQATAHAFSFGEHYDAERISFGPMVCHDDHLLAQGSGFPRHHHAGLTIVTWVLTGAVQHVDSTGDDRTLGRDQVAVLEAGVGVDHAEIAAAPMTRFVQVWLNPPVAAADADDSQAGPPTYVVTPVEVPHASLVEVSRPQPGAAFSVVRLGDGQSITLPAAPLLHVYVARGALVRSSMAEPLHDGDAFLFTDEPAHEVTAGAETELLVWAFD